MRKIILYVASSLDGFIAGKRGEIDWLFSGDYGYKKFYNSIDTVIMGRKTYELSLSFGKPPFPGKKCYVFSRKARKDRYAVFSSDPLRTARKLKSQRGKVVWLVGGGEIASKLINSGLVNEIMLFVHPIILGSGIPLFTGIKKSVKLKLVKSKSYESGLVQLNFSVIQRQSRLRRRASS